MRYGSVCSGVEAASLAWIPLGWECKFVSEVEPFPCAVLQQRFGASAPINVLDPNENGITDADRKLRLNWIKQYKQLNKKGKIPNEGDFTKIGKKYAGQIDLLVGGTPCQDLSVAGKRAGFDGERSSLAIDFVRLAYESQCKWFIWENVPGVFSSNKGRDFATLLSLFTGREVQVPKDGFKTAGFVRNARRDRYGVAWRVLDAQFTRVPGFPFGIPQRRRRVFVVGYFGDWVRAAEVLLEPNRLSWNTPPRIKARESIAGFTGQDFALAGGELCNSGTDGGELLEQSSVKGFDCYNQILTDDVSMTVTSKRSDPHHVPCAVQSVKSTFWNGKDVAETLTAKGADDRMPDKNRLPCVISSTDTYHLNSAEDGSCLTPKARDYKDPQIVCLNDQGGSVMAVEENGNAGTLRANAHGNEQIVCYENHANDSRVKEMGESCQTLNSRMGTGGGNLPLVQEYYDWHSQNVRASKIEDDCSPTIPAAMGMGGASMTTPMFVRDCYAVDQGAGKSSCSVSENISPTLATTHGGEPAVQVIHGAETPISNSEHANPVTCNHNGLENCVAIAFEPGMAKRDGSDNRFTEEFSGTLRSNAGDNQTAVAIAENVIGRKVETGGNGVVAQEELAYTQNATGVMGVCNSTVRRLIPVECERLMGFPDNHTRIVWNGKSPEECPDAPRYKACGNSMCVNVMRWIGMRIDRVDKMVGSDEQ